MKTELISIFSGIFAILTALTPVHAQSILDSSYLESGVNYTQSRFSHVKPNTYTAVLGGYKPVYQNERFSLGLAGSLHTTFDDTRNFTYQAQGFTFSAIPNYSITPELRIFGNATAAIERSRMGFAYLGHSKDNHFNWGLGAGLEYVIDRISLIASADYVHLTGDHRSDTWVFGGQVNYWLDQNWGVGGGYSYHDHKQGHANRLFARVRYRF